MSLRSERRSRRPAEKTTAIAAAVVVVLARVFGIEDQGVRDALVIVIGALPGAVTWLVERRWKRAMELRRG